MTLTLVHPWWRSLYAPLDSSGAPYGRIHVCSTREGLGSHSECEYVGQFPGGLRRPDGTQYSEVDGVRVDSQFGPVVLNEDGSWCYIEGWRSMSSALREATIKRIAAKNQETRTRVASMQEAGQLKLGDQARLKKSDPRANEGAVQIEVLSAHHRTPGPGVPPPSLAASAAEDLALEGALAMQRELIEAFSDREFQGRLADLGERCAKGEAFNKARQQLFETVQRVVLPKYGFEGNGQGFSEVMRLSRGPRRAAWAGDPELQRSTGEINALLYSVQSTRRPVRAYDGTQDFYATFTLAAALELQLELIHTYGHDSFQAELASLGNVYGKDSPKYDASKSQLVQSVQKGILPRYGFSGGAKGGIEMMSAYKAAPWHGLDDIAFNGNNITFLLGGAGHVPLDLRQGLNLRRELLKGFQRPNIREKWEECLVHPADSNEYQAMRRKLLLEVQAAVLPKYGFPGNQNGVSLMQEEFQGAPWRGNAEVKKLDKAISALTSRPPSEAERALARKDFIRARCDTERAKPPQPWIFGVTMEQLDAHHAQKAPGMFYGLEFPWNSEMLRDLGPAWMTRAFHAAGTMSAENEVTEIIRAKEVVVGGGAGSKMFIDVAYADPEEGLHTRLFAKIPFPYDNKRTKSDRMTMSVYQQGQEVDEINTHRLLEARLPFRIPRYYYGDMSNLTTNFIIMTERVPFGEQEGGNTFDPPYEKNKDWNLKGDPKEYYLLMVRYGATLAGMYKSEQLAPFAQMHKFWSPNINPPETYGMSDDATGMPQHELRSKMTATVNFLTVTAGAVFGPSVTSEDFIRTYKEVLTLCNAYSNEMTWWSSRDPRYVAWTHININVDNSYFWRDQAGNLDCGLLDWGGVCAGSVGNKLWWWLYCCEYDFLTENIDELLLCFIDTYRESGGPELELRELKMQFIIAAMKQGLGLMGAVPQIYMMCPKREWATITDRFDRRISDMIDGKSNLRVYIGTFINITRMIIEWDIAGLLSQWVDEFTAVTGMKKKIVIPP